MPPSRARDADADKVHSARSSVKDVEHKGQTRPGTGTWSTGRVGEGLSPAEPKPEPVGARESQKHSSLCLVQYVQLT